MKILCLFGKYQYGDVQRGESTEYVSFIPALRALGHEVILFDSWNKSLHDNFAALNCALVDQCRRSCPDVIFWVALNVEIWLETLDYLRSVFGIQVIHWAPDDSWKFRQHSKFIAPHVDLCVTTYPEFLAAYECLGAKAIASGWGVPEAWRREVIPSSACLYDVSFIGAAQPIRKKMVAVLKSRGIEVDCFGHGWPAGSIEAQNVPDVFRNSRISLNFANSFGENQIKARVFEVTGAGGFLLTQIAPGLESIFTSGKEIAVFNSLDECAHHIRRYLNDQGARDRIARFGNQRTLTEYTYVERLHKILSSLPEVLDVSLISIDDKEFRGAVVRHNKSIFLSFFAKILTAFGIVIFGRKRGSRFARRVCFEISWRIFGQKTYRSSGVVGRMFYE